MTDAVEGLIEALNRRDLEAFCGGYAEAIVIEDARGRVLARGQAGLRSRYGPMFEAHPHLRCEILARIAVGQYVVQEEVVSGRSPEPERLVVVYHVVDGRVEHERIVR